MDRDSSMSYKTEKYTVDEHGQLRANVHCGGYVMYNVAVIREDINLIDSKEINDYDVEN